jgi:uncharacterized protein YegL
MRTWRGPRDRGLDVEAMTFDDGENRAQRLPIALALDTSCSMSGKPIERLNEALAGLAADLRGDLQLSAIAELAIITFGEGGVTAWRGDRPVPPGTSPFMPANRFKPPRLRAGGVTPLTAAVHRTIGCVAEEKAELKRRFLQYYRPHIWLFSDGCPTDDRGCASEDWRGLPAVIRKHEADGRFLFFSVSTGLIDAAGDAVLRQLAPDAHLRLDGIEFASVLKLVSSSAESAARGHSADAIKRRAVTAIQMPLDRI